MALIINADMPKNCYDCYINKNWTFDYICPLIEKDADLSTWLRADCRHPSCPIIGEIPYELENFIIGISQLPREKPKTATEAKEALAYEELERRMKKEMQNGSDN